MADIEVTTFEDRVVIEHGNTTTTVEIDGDNDLTIEVTEAGLSGREFIVIPFAALPKLKAWLDENLPDDQS